MVRNTQGTKRKQLESLNTDESYEPRNKLQNTSEKQFEEYFERNASEYLEHNVTKQIHTNLFDSISSLPVVQDDQDDDGDKALENLIQSPLSPVNNVYNLVSTPIPYCPSPIAESIQQDEESSNYTENTFSQEYEEISTTLDKHLDLAISNQLTNSLFNVESFY